jgi:hypothetical protein
MEWRRKVGNEGEIRALIQSCPKRLFADLSTLRKRDEKEWTLADGTSCEGVPRASNGVPVGDNQLLVSRNASWACIKCRACSGVGGDSPVLSIVEHVQPSRLTVETVGQWSGQDILRQSLRILLERVRAAQGLARPSDART